MCLTSITQLRFMNKFATMFLGSTRILGIFVLVVKIMKTTPNLIFYSIQSIGKLKIQGYKFQQNMHVFLSKQDRTICSSGPI